MWPLPAVSSRVVVAAVILSLAFAAGWSVNGWRLKNAHGKELRKMLQSGLDAVAKREAVIAESNAVIAGLETQKGKVKIIYRDAVRTDPECKAWSEQPIACPRSWRP
jgi:hypothetical protein